MWFLSEIVPVILLMYWMCPIHWLPLEFSRLQWISKYEYLNGMLPSNRIRMAIKRDENKPALATDQHSSFSAKHRDALVAKAYSVSDKVTYWLMDGNEWKQKKMAKLLNALQKETNCVEFLWFFRHAFIRILHKPKWTFQNLNRKWIQTHVVVGNQLHQVVAVIEIFG